MKTVIKLIASLLLLLNGTGAMWGGYALITTPDGSSMGWSPGMLQHTPFGTYLIPGIILFTVNGLFSMATLALLVFRHKQYARYVVVQGFLLTGWIAIQVLLLRTFVLLHFIMGLIGVSLIVCGYILAAMDTSDAGDLKLTGEV